MTMNFSNVNGSVIDLNNWISSVSCRDWCLQQYLAASYEGLWIIFAVFLIVSVMLFMKTKLFTYSLEEHQTFMKGLQNGGLFTVWLLLVGFWVWFLWLK